MRVAAAYVSLLWPNFRHVALAGRVGAKSIQGKLKAVFQTVHNTQIQRWKFVSASILDS